MNVFEGYRVTSTNSNARQKASVRVYNPQGVKIGEVFISTSNGYRYLKERRKSKHLDSLFDQCCVVGDMPADLFNEVFEIVRK